MSDLSITASDVAVVEAIDQATGPAAEAIDAGEAVFIGASTGKYELADQGEATEDDVEGVAVISANVANITITILRKGLLDVGDALSGLDYGALVYLSDTPGQLADADPGNGVVVGQVVPAWGYTTADKLLRVDPASGT
jgi:hypothetical protein